MTDEAYKHATVRYVNTNKKGFLYACPACTELFEVLDDTVHDKDYFSCPKCLKLIKLGGWLV